MQRFPFYRPLRTFQHLWKECPNDSTDSNLDLIERSKQLWLFSSLLNIYVLLSQGEREGGGDKLRKKRAASFLATFSAFTENFESVRSETLESFTDFGYDINATKR